MDRRTALALALCLLVFALFTALQSKYAPRPLATARPGAAGSAAPGAGGAARGQTPLAPGSAAAGANPTGVTGAGADPVP